MALHDRRSFLGTLAAVALAGCSQPTTSETQQSATPTATATSTTAEQTTEPTPEPTPEHDGEGWPLPKRDAGRTAHAPDERGPDEPSLAWAVQGDMPETDQEYIDRAYTTPVIAGGSLFVGRQFATGPERKDPKAHFLDAYRLDGTQRWAYELPSRPQAPSVANGVVYVPTDEAVHAVDPTEGTRHWRTEVPAYHGLTPAGDRLYVAADDQLSALTTEGDVVWQRNVRTGHPPAVDDGNLFVGGWEGGVTSVDAATGEERWSRTPAEMAIRDLAVTGRTVLAVGERLYALNRETGATRWTGPKPSYYVASDGEIAYTASLEGDIRAHALEDGAVQWSKNIDRSGPNEVGGIYAPPAVTETALHLVRWPRSFVSFTKDGNRHWAHEVDEIREPRSVVVTDGKIFATAANARLLCLDS